MQEPKMRKSWWLYEGDELIAEGIIYAQGNVTITWRKDKGHIMEICSSLSTLLEMFPTADGLKRELY